MSFYKVKEFADNSPQLCDYGTSEFSHYMYSLVKMIRPEAVVELGTGIGATAFFAAQACKENNKGHVYSIDDSSQAFEWPLSISINYQDFLSERTKDFELEDYITFIDKEITLDIGSFPDIKNIDILFNDVDCEPVFVISALTWLLNRKNRECYYIIDRGYEVYVQMFLQRLVTNLNNNKIPVTMFDITDNVEGIKNAVYSSRFTLHNVLRPSHTAGNDSFSIIKIEQNDW